MIELWIALALIAVVVAVVVVRRRRPSRAPIAAPRAPMPEVLVEEVPERPVLEEAPNLANRLGAARGVFDRLRQGGEDVDEESLAMVEEVLLRSDVGVAMTDRVVTALRAGEGEGSLAERVRQILLGVFERERGVAETADEGRVPVWLFVGVNGVGKTTTIGKLARREVEAGHRVVLAAGDTFRAAAADQLAMWAERTGADIVRAGEGADPGSVVHDAIGRAAARGADLVLADTAGRRANSQNLLDELSKVRRVADRDPGQVVETLLVLDATTGQNALAQAREFLAAAQVSGVVLTKLDGTARGGIVVAIESELGLPVKFIGVGEGAGDLIDFDPVAFVDSLVGA